MEVVKRNGKTEEVSFDKITKRLKHLCLNLHPKLTNIDYIKISQKVISELHNGVSTIFLDELAAQICTSKVTEHPEYGDLAGRLIISNNHKCTLGKFSDYVELLQEKKGLLSTEIYTIIKNNSDKIDMEIDNGRDYEFDYFGYKTLEKAYLVKIDGLVIERIQYLFMRVSLGLHKNNLEKVFETYNFMSQKYFIHATPTLFHSGLRNPQLLSCFLMGMEDSVNGIYKAVSDCAKISQWAGGIGLWVHDIRAKGSLIKSTNGMSNGLIPLMRVLNNTARHINQSGKRNGSFAIYVEPWHLDIIEFLDAKKNHGDEDARARDLFYALWVPDLFMKRVRDNKDWTLFSPNETKELSNTYGSEFEMIYEAYENDPTINKVNVKAQDIWKKILESQIETGTPYILYKDAANSKSNQKNLGIIKSSNLCTEIIEYSNTEQYACCTLASIGLPKYIVENTKQYEFVIYSKKDCKYCDFSKAFFSNNSYKYTEYDISNEKYKDSLKELLKYIPDTVPQIFVKKDTGLEYIGGFNNLIVFVKPEFNYKKLYEVTKVIVQNLNKIIDINYYPVTETRYSNKLHRPIGIGVQGLADVYSKMRYSYDSEEAVDMNKKIFATIYYASMMASMEIARDRKNSMIELKELRKQYTRRFTKANEYIGGSDSQKWLTGSGYIQPENTDRRFTKSFQHLVNLENDLLPIDEEFKDLDDEHIGAYSSFTDSPISKGIFQFDLWNQKPITYTGGKYGLYLDWDTLKNSVIEHGVRNSLLLAPMPTASTSQILGNNECIEPFTSNIYSRNTIAGTFVIVNKYLLRDLIDINLWSANLKNKIISESGSIQNIKEIPAPIRDLYKTAWDLSQKVLIDQSADRGSYICQSQSLNLFIKNPNFANISSMHMYSWKKGLKTGLYYLRTKSIAKAQQFSIEPENKNDCEMCSA